MNQGRAKSIFKSVAIVASWARAAWRSSTIELLGRELVPIIMRVYTPMMHSRWAGLATWEECLAVERGGSSRDTIEPWVRARSTVKSVWATDEPRGQERINGANGMSDIEEDCR
jgi:hypothetical protein